MRITQFLGLLAAGGMVMSGCSKDNTAITAWKTWLSECPILSYSLSSDDPILARGGGVVVRAAEFQEWVQRRMPAAARVALTPADRRRFLDQLLYQKVTAQIFRDSGVKIDPVGRQTLEQMEYGYLFSSYIRQFSGSDQDLRNYYQAHTKEFNLARIAFSHVLAKSAADARRLQMLIQKGRPLPGLKKEIMAFPIRPGTIDPEIQKVIFAMKPGQILMVNTSKGPELVRKDIAPPSPIPSFESVKDQVRARVQSDKLAALYQQALAQSKLNVNEKALNSIDLLAGPAASR